MPRRLWLPLLVVLSLFAASGPARTFADSGEQKTVHVKEYKRKDGTTVKAHDRKASKKSGGSSTSSASSGKPKKEKKQSAFYSPPSISRDERGRIQRNDAARHAFARQTGYPNGRPGYVIDHIVPLACGGADTPANMQWQTVEQAKAKDKVERRGCR